MLHSCTVRVIFYHYSVALVLSVLAHSNLNKTRFIKANVMQTRYVKANMDLRANIWLFGKI